MKTVVIDGVECEVIERGVSTFHQGYNFLYYRPLPKPQKTLVQVAAESIEREEKELRHYEKAMTTALDEIERRLQALEGKGK